MTAVLQVIWHGLRDSVLMAWEVWWGLVLWVLIGWQFAVAEYVGGIVMIVLMSASLRLLVSPRLERLARVHAQLAGSGHEHHDSTERSFTWRERIRARDAWVDVAQNF